MVSRERESRGTVPTFSLTPVCIPVVLFVPMLREIYAHVKAVDLRELMHSVGFIYGNIFPQY